MRLCWIVLLFFCAGQISSQNYIGTDFRIAFLKNLNTTFNTPPIFEISVEAIQDADLVLEYGNPGDSFYIIETATVLAGDVFVFTFDDDQFLNQETLNVIETRSFHLSATGNVRAFGFHNRLYFAEATSVLPTSSLGNEYLVMAFEDGNGALPSLFNILASEDNTEVTVIPTSGTAFGGSGTPFDLTLNAGEVITISSSGDLTGSSVISNNEQPIAVFAGQQHGLVGSGCGADSHIYDQNIPVQSWGDIYAITPVSGSDSELLRILASEDDTEIFIGCDLLTTLNAGEIYEEFVGDPFLLTGSNPFSVAMLTPSSECSGLNTGDPNMRVVLPLDQANTSINIQTNYWFQDPDQVFNVVQLVMPTDETDNITINDIPITGWEPFDSNPNLSYTGFVVQSLTNLLSIESSTPFWSEFVGLSFYDAMTMNFGATTTMDLPPFNLDIVDLGPDIILCPGETAILDPQLGVEGIWQDGSTSVTYTVDEPGTYSVTIDDACGDGSDEIVVLAGLLPTIDLQSAYSTCGNTEVEIGVDSEEDVAYEWSTGQEISIITVNQPGVYTLQATSIDGCSVSAETTVTSLPGPAVEIFGPSEICNDQTVILTAIGDEGTFLWEDGTVGDELVVSDPGNYAVTLTDDLGCSSIANFDLNALSDPIVLPFDTTFCEGESFTFTLLSPNAELTWPGLSDDAFLTVSSGGSYTYQAENNCGILESTLVLVSDDCSCPTFVPNAFTPNSDGLNDLFIPEVGCPVDNYKLSIFNRWGQEIFVSEDETIHWNGASENGGDYFAPDGVYFYLLEFENNLKSIREVKQFSGNVTLLR